MRTLVTLALLLALAPGAAWAACAASDIAGTYQLFGWSHATNNVLWTKCTLKVGSSGAVQSGTSCKQRDVVGNKRWGKVQGGGLAVKSS